MSEPIDFWFDFSSPYSYLAGELIDDLAAKYGRTVRWHPIMLGAVFKVTGAQPLTSVPLKGVYSKRDFHRSARFLGVTYRFPSKFPQVTLMAARAFYWLYDQDSAKAHAFARAVFRALWADDRDVADAAVIADIAGKLGIDCRQLEAAVATPEIKERLKQETEAGIAKGMFGAPYIMVDGEPFMGADRLPQIEKWLQTGGF
jgi:2-hydroxychromene-2-carboxylate isomerase